MVLSYCGLRWGELSGLRVMASTCDVRGWPSSRRSSRTRSTSEAPKDYEHRSIPIPGFLIEPLRAMVRRRPDEPVFFGARTRTWLRNHTFRNGWFDPAAIAIGLPGLTPHELRHTSASLAVSAGANVEAVQRMLRHASAAITLDRYADLFEDDFDAVAVALDHAALRADAGKAPCRPWRVADRYRKTPGFTRGFSSVIPAGFEPALPP